MMCLIMKEYGLVTDNLITISYQILESGMKEDLIQEKITDFLLIVRNTIAQIMAGNVNIFK